MKNQTTSTSTAALRDLWARSGGALEALAELDQDLVAQARSKATTLCSIDGNALEASYNPTRALPCITDSIDFETSAGTSFGCGF